MTGQDWAAVLVAAALCAAGGLLVPMLIRSVPEPEPEPDPEPDPEPGEEAGSAAEDDEPKMPYAEVAAAPGLAWKSALAAGACGAVVGWSVGWDWSLLYLVPLVPVGVALAVVDWRTRYLPTRIVAPSYVALVVLVVVCWLATGDPEDLARAGLGWLVAGGVFLLLWLIHPRGLGYGDVRLSGVLGIALGYLGWGELVVGVYGGFLLGAVGGGLLSVLRIVQRKAFPFGPFMLVGALVGIAYGADVWAYLVRDGA
jgi:leader peptidase (prepilin peptidase)/N-methyltransferase